MNRIDKKFKELKDAGRKGLVGFLTAGDPDPVLSEKNIRCAIDNGLDILELGVPYSDPTADGPTIQAASQRALASGMNMGRVLDLVRNLRRDYDLPIVLFGYVNPFFKYGYRKICEDAAMAGVDAMLIVDLPYEETGEIRDHMDANGLYLVPLAAPTTSRERAGHILAGASGFVYYIMVTGVTGTRTHLVADLEKHLEDLRGCTDLPIAVGFGISNGEQATQAARLSDAVVVGSAFIKAACENRLEPLVKEIREALDAC